MDKHAAYIKNRLSLRPPQTESLEILGGLADLLPLRKNTDLAAAQEQVRAYDAERAVEKGTAAVFAEFERTFPCVCFALATGVGKTRLMGAFIAWLNQAKGIKNFFVLAPNLTIYNKLIEDFSNPRSSKYVFPGIGDFVHRPPGIITGRQLHEPGSAFPLRRIHQYQCLQHLQDQRGNKGRQAAPDQAALRIYRPILLRATGESGRSGDPDG